MRLSWRMYLTDQSFICKVTWRRGPGRWPNPKTADIVHFGRNSVTSMMSNPLFGKCSVTSATGSRRTFLKAAVPVLALAGVTNSVKGADPTPESNGEWIKKLVGVFEKKDTTLMKLFFHPDVVFENYGTPKIEGMKATLELWDKVFQKFETVKFETVHQVANGNLVLAEQIHHLGLKGKKVAPIMNMAIYEFKDGKIVAWRDYTDSSYTRKLLEA